MLASRSNVGTPNAPHDHDRYHDQNDDHHDNDHDNHDNHDNHKDHHHHHRLSDSCQFSNQLLPKSERHSLTSASTPNLLPCGQLNQTNTAH